jgi:hypothetical protein
MSGINFWALWFLSPCLLRLLSAFRSSSFICLVNRERHQISMPRLFKGKPVAIRPLFISGYSHISSFPAANTGSLDVQLWIHARLACAGRMARRPRRAARGFLRSYQAKGHADMRLTCGSAVVGCVLTHFKLLLAARGPPETGFEPRPVWSIVSLRNSRISLRASRIQTRC